MTVMSPRDDTADLPVTVTTLHEMVLQLRQQVADLSAWVTAVLIANGHPNPAEQTPAEPPDPQPPVIDPVLTPRQYAVAELVRDGLTNWQIAERLVISKRTVDAHVEHILKKLDFTSRAQVAAWVVQTPPRAPRVVGDSPWGLGSPGGLRRSRGCSTG